MANKSASKNAPSWLYQDSEYIGKSYAFPSDDVDPEIKKGPEWCMAWAKSLYGKMLNNQAYVSVDRMMRFENLRLYATGNQPVDKYMDMLIGNVSNNPQRKGYYNVDWGIFSPMPAYLSKTIGRLVQQNHKISVSAIDPISGVERENEMWDKYYELQFGKKEQAIRAAAKIPNQEAGTRYIPSSMEELEAFNNAGGFKLKHEVDFEKALAYTDYISDVDDLRARYYFDMLAIGCGAYLDYVDIDGIEKYEYLDFARVIIDGNRESGFKKSRFWAYLRFESIATVRAKTGLPESELIKYCQKYQEFFGNPAFLWDQMQGDMTNIFDPITNTYIYDNYLVPTIQGEVLSNDIHYRTKRNTKYGTTIYGKSDWGKIWDTPNRKTVTRNIPNKYKFTWIIGSDICYDYGVANDIPRTGPKKIPTLSIHADALPGKSMVERCLGPLDQIELAYLKMQNAIADAAPNGLAIEFNALNNINLGNGDMKPINLISLRRASGDIIYKATTHNGKYNMYQGKPIENIPGGVGPLFNELIQTFELNFNFIAELSGIDRLSAVAPKGGEVTATEINQTMASASDVIQGVIKSWEKVRESGARNAVERIRQQVKYRDGYDVYYPILGSATMENFRISREYADRTYGIKIEVLPDGTYAQTMLQTLGEALKPGKDGENISAADYLMISEMIFKGMLKQARMLLNYRLNLRKEEARKIQEENIKLTGEEARKTNAQKEAAEARKRKDELVKELIKGLFQMQAQDSMETSKLQTEVLKSYLLPELAQTTQPTQNQQ
jgi:hypothetical protein